MSFIVAIDGPAGSGKGTVTKLVGQRLNLVNIDSGAAYRCIALETIERKVKIEEKQKIIKMLDDIKIEFRIENGENVIYLNNKNVGDRIRQKDVTQIVSQISSIKEVRFTLNDIFRNCANGKDIIMEGRDIGTCVFPNANVKIYLDASPEERAKRRFKQNQEKGIDMSYNEIIENIKKRDKNDMQKEIGALKQAEDAIYIDSSDMTIEQVVERIIQLIDIEKIKIHKK